MALELLAGPISFSVDGVSLPTWGAYYQQTYIQGIGLISLGVNPSGQPGGTYVAQLDGAAMFRSPFAWGAGSLILVPDLRKDTGIAMWDGNYSDFDAIACAPYPTPWLTTAAGASVASCVLPDRFLKIVWDKALWSGLTDSVNYVEEYAFTTNPPTGDATVSRTNKPGVICLAWRAEGQIRFYDTVNRIQVGETIYLGESFDACWYIRKWDIFLTLESNQLKVFANVVRPSSLSNPVALSAIAPGLVTQMQVRLLGAQNEPCVGEIINWAITSGDGFLVASQSETDENGYAQIGYACPVGSSGSATIAAEVDF